MEHRKKLGWKGLLLIMICIFCIYKMDQIALETDSHQSSAGKIDLKYRLVFLFNLQCLSEKLGYLSLYEVK